jgi:hypothetical protein
VRTAATAATGPAIDPVSRFCKHGAMIGLRLRPGVHAALAGGALAVSGGCPGNGDEDSETDTDTDTDTDTGGDTEDTMGTLPTTTLAPTTDPPPPPPPPPDTTPPALVAVDLLDPQILRLQFTEALAPVDLVNPKRFRLSVAGYRPEYYYSLARTNYYDLEVFNNQQVCDYVCYEYYGCYYQCSYLPAVPVEALDLLPDAYDPAAAILLLSNPIFTRVCQVASGFDSGFPEGSRGGLFLHYAAGGAAQITDAAQLPLASIGIEWVKTSDDYRFVEALDFPDMNPFLPIPCPF